MVHCGQGKLVGQREAHLGLGQVTQALVLPGTSCKISKLISFTSGYLFSFVGGYSENIPRFQNYTVSVNDISKIMLDCLQFQAMRMRILACQGFFCPEEDFMKVSFIAKCASMQSFNRNMTSSVASK